MKVRYISIYLLMGILLPYTVLGYGSTNIIIFLMAVLGLFLVDRMTFNEKVLIGVLSFSLYIVGHTLAFNRTLNSLIGMIVYLIIPVSYVLFSSIINKENSEEIIKKFIYGVTIVTTFFIIYRGIIGDSRIAGNLGYANSYGLLLLLSIYFNKEIGGKISLYIDLILYIGILFTGSRTSLILLIVFLGINLIRDKNIDILYRFLQGILLYILLEKFLAITIFILPLIIYGLSLKIDNKLKQKLLIANIVIIGMLSFSGNINTIERIKNISLDNGSFKERIISFEDGIEAIKNNPLGYGANNYMYENGKFKTANYNIRYLHNSILQASFEFGIIGGSLLIIILIYFGIKIYKRKKLSNSFIIYIICIIHSLLDFDFAYGTILMLIMFIISLEIENDKSINIHEKSIIPVIFIISILLVNELILVIGRNLTINGDIVRGIGVLEKTIIKDYRYDYTLSDSYYLNYLDNKNRKDILEANKLIERASEKYDNNLINYKRAMIEKEISYEKYIDTMEEIFEGYRYYPNYYKELYEEAQKEEDDLLKKLIIEKLDESKNTINRKAKNLPKQIIIN